LNQTFWQDREDLPGSAVIPINPMRLLPSFQIEKAANIGCMLYFPVNVRVYFRKGICLPKISF
jgi:hypothetical protein